VLTAVLSCLNSGMYTASRMLFVLAARREAPPQFVSVTKRGVPMVAILVSSIFGFLCVVAAAISPDLIFDFLMNSAGSIALFVYLLIAISQIRLRYQTPDSQLKVKMWLFPVLSILTVIGILAVLVQMGMQQDTREQLVLSLLAWAVVIVMYLLNKRYLASRPVVQDIVSTKRPHRVLVLANQTVESAELLDELRRIGVDNATTYYVVVPVSPIETGTAETHGPLDIMEATHVVAKQRLDQTLETLRSENHEADGTLGDYRPLRALAAAVDTFHPDQIVISTLPAEASVWNRFDVVDRARAEHNLPVTHVVSRVHSEESVL
jgi:GABA permease